MRLKAIATIQCGTPKKPVTIPAGAEFDPAKNGMDEDEVKKLIACGHADPVAEKVVAAPQTE